MRAVVQRVSQASVSVDGKVVGKIGPGLLVFLGIRNGDTGESLHWMVKKIVNMRIFSDEQDRMNLSAIDKGYSMLCISQFTLLADCRKGNRPNFMDAAPPETANAMYEEFCEKASGHLEVQKGVFGAMMEIEAINDGPVTIVVDRD